MQSDIRQLIEQLADPCVNVRSQAALSLGRLGAAEAVMALVSALRHDSDLNVKEDATWALVRIGQPAVTWLIEMLRADDARARHDAAHALGKIGAGRAIGPLAAALRDPDAAVRLKAAFALGQIGDPQAAAALVERFDDSHPDVRWTAAEAVERFGAAALTPLVDALRSDNWEMRELAVSTLGRLDDGGAVAALAAALADAHWAVRFAVVTALGEFDSAEAVAALRRSRDDADARVRALAGRLTVRTRKSGR